MLIINSFWIEIISKLSFNISLIIFEAIVVRVIPELLKILNGQFEEIKIAINVIFSSIGLKWLFIFNMGQHLSIGFFCLTNFSIILKEKDRPIKFLIMNLIKSILFYWLSVTILRGIFRNYIFKNIIDKINEVQSITEESKNKILEVIEDFQKISIRTISNLLGNFNNSLDKLLIGSLYITLFSSPKCLKDKNIFYFRLLSILPIVYIIVSLFFRTLYGLGIITLSEFISPIFVGPKFTIFGYFITFLLYVKKKENKYKIFDEEHNIIPNIIPIIDASINLNDKLFLKLNVLKPTALYIPKSNLS
jgi:hypothetical protein